MPSGLYTALVSYSADASLAGYLRENSEGDSRVIFTLLASLSSCLLHL